MKERYDEDPRVEGLGEYPATDLQPHISKHVKHSLGAAIRLTKKELVTLLHSVEGRRHEVTTPDEIEVQPHEEKDGHFIVRHKKGVIFTATGAALLTAAAGIIYKNVKNAKETQK